MIAEPPRQHGDRMRATSRTWRRIWFASTLHGLRCADGHRIKDPLTFDHGCLRCRYTVRADGKECDNLTYMIGGGLMTLDGHALILLAEVRPDELALMPEACKTRDDALAFLGIVLTS